MKSIIKRILFFSAVLVGLLVFTLLGASAASPGGIEVTQGGSAQSFSTLSQAVNFYKQNNPSAAQHRITASHKVVYADDAYFKDNVNATASMFECYAYTGAKALQTKLSSLGVNVQLRSDKTSASGAEILVGVVDRAAQSSFLPLVDANEYGIMVTDNAIILLAWQDAALKVCVDTFTAYLSSSTLSLPVGFCAVGVADARWTVDFARPGNTSLTAAQYVNDDSLQLLYTGTGATNAGYLAYCGQLAADGFALVWQSTVGNNEFRMYQNATKGIALYVAYNDYTYQAEFDALYQANYTAATNAYLPGEYDACIRIVSSPLSSVTLPGNTVNSQQSYVKVTDSYMTMIGLASAQVGTGYVILLEDGRFVIIDGGNVSSKKNGVYPESKAIWDAMLALYKKAYGANAAPTAARPLRVAAWYLTHAHSDHYNAFLNMVEMIGADSAKKAVFKMDYVIANLPGEYSLFNNTSTKWGYGNSQVIHNMKSKVGGFTFLKVHTGQRIYLANLMIEVLMTFEDHLPFRINNTNDTNTVTRFHIKSSGAAKNATVSNLSGKATTVMFLGDSWRSASRYLCAMYGSYLRSDISQIAHHGNIGCEKELYEQIAPTGVLFNHDLSSFKTYVWGTATSSNPETKHAYAVDQYVVKALPSVMYVWAAVSGSCTTLQFTTAGAGYDTAFDLITGRAVSYVDAGKPQSNQNGFLKRAHVHSYGTAWQKYSTTQHQRACACGYVAYAAHGWNAGVVTWPTTHLQAGIRTYTCTDCGESREESVPKLTAHEYGDWQQYNGAQHKRECACEHVEYGAHNWGSGSVTQQPTHFEQGLETYTCTDCGESREEAVPALAEHEYGDWQQYNGVQHKRECACEHVEYEAHRWDEGVVLAQPTHLAPGSKMLTCTDCGETKTGELPQITAHTYGEWVIVKDASEDASGKQERSCACGHVVEQEIPALEGAGHLDTEVKGGIRIGAVVGVAAAVAVLFFTGGFVLALILSRKKKHF